jgi:hypothetical protein
MKKLYTGLVTAKPPREVPGESIKSIVQDLSSANPTITVPQGDTILDERERALLLYDTALTPTDMPGAYGLEPWALDTARIVRAAAIAGNKIPAVTDGDLPGDALRITNEITNHYYDSGKYHQGQAARIRMETLTGINLIPTEMRQKIKDRDWTRWESAVEFAKELQEAAKQDQEQPKGPPPPKGNPGGNPPPGTGDQPSDEWLEHGEEDFDMDEAMKPEEGSIYAESAEAKEQKQLEASVIEHPKTGQKPRISRFNPDPWAQGKIPKPSFDAGIPGKLENENSIDILPMKSKRKKGTRKRRAELEGANIVALHRFPLDGKVFKGALVKGGCKGRGTVLVDMSGSMCWRPEDFQALLEVLPECSVYGYSGYGGGNAGRLVLLADRGKAADMAAVERWLDGKGSNIVDDSCLRFLAKASKPRVWISDGGVTGCRDRQTPYITTLCNAAIVAGGIIRVRTAKEAVKVLSGR